MSQSCLLLAFVIVNLLFFQDALKNAIARLLIHLKNFVGYDFLHSLRRKVVERAPVLMSVHEVVLEALDGVFVHIGPFLAHCELFKQRWILH